MSFLAHLSQRLKVSYCDRYLSVVCCPLCINIFFKRYLLLNHWSKFKIIDMNALYQNCINGSASPNMRADRAVEKKSLK